MSSVLSPTLESSTSAVTAQLAGLRLLGCRLESFLEERLAALDKLREQLAAVELSWKAERARGDEATSELLAVRRELESERELRTRVERERDEATGALDVLETALDEMDSANRAERARLAEILGQLEATCRERDEALAASELAQSQAVALASERDQLLASRAASATTAPRSADSSADAERIARLETERAEMESQMEAILESASELAASHARENERMRDEQALWREEIESLRLALANVVPDVRRGGGQETLKPNREAAPRVRAGSRPAAPSPTPGHDPVLQSVAAEFSKMRGRK